MTGFPISPCNVQSPSVAGECTYPHFLCLSMEDETTESKFTADVSETGQPLRTLLVLKKQRKFGGIRYEERSRGRSSPDSLALWACGMPRR